MPHLAVLCNSIHLYLPGTADELRDDHWMLLEENKRVEGYSVREFKDDKTQPEQGRCLLQMVLLYLYAVFRKSLILTPNFSKLETKQCVLLTFTTNNSIVNTTTNNSI